MDCGVLSSGLSDHDIIYYVSKLHCKKLPSEIKTFRNYTKYEHDKFCEELKRVDWQTECDAFGNQTGSIHYVDQLWISFKNLFMAIADRHAPMISKRTRGIQTSWMSLIRILLDLSDDSLHYSALQAKIYLKSDFLNKLPKNSFKFISVSTNFTFEFLWKLKVRKASSIDQMPARGL